MSYVEYLAKIEKVDSTGGWHYVRIPKDTHNRLREMGGKGGNVPVEVTIGKTSWPSTTMSMGEQRWFVAIKAEVRKKEGLSEGDTVLIKITPIT